MKLINLAVIASGVLLALSGCTNINKSKHESNTTSSHAQLSMANTAKAVVSELSAQQQLDVLVAQYYDESLMFSPLSATYNGRNEFNNQFTPVISSASRDKKPLFIKNINSAYHL